MQEIERRKDKRLNPVTSIYDHLYNVKLIPKVDGDFMVEHNVYKTEGASPKPWRFENMRKFSKWLDNRLLNRKHELVERLTPH